MNRVLDRLPTLEEGLDTGIRRYDGGWADSPQRERRRALFGLRTSYALLDFDSTQQSTLA